MPGRRAKAGATSLHARELGEGWDRCTPHGVLEELMMRKKKKKRSSLSCAPPRGHSNGHQGWRDRETAQMCLSRG